MTESTFYWGLAYAWLGVAAVTFLALLFIAAPYGRHNRGGFGPQIDATVGWILMEAPSPILVAVLFLASGGPLLGPGLVFLLLWEAHYVNRAFVFPLRRRSRQQTMPLMVAGLAILFNLVNAYLNGRWLFHLAPAYTWSWFLDPRFLVGLALFVTGYAINQHADAVLFRLRQGRESGYQIPRGGLYRYLSCPNYFGETLEWVGWAIATWSLGGLVFAAWTAANLVPRALANHRWYRETFADYPPERRAFLPFVL
jgi:3-oxo-5-alpha-steroid 4-dehydrogenase 1